MTLNIIISKNNTRRAVRRSVRAILRTCRLWVKENPGHDEPIVVAVMSKTDCRIVFRGVSALFLTTYLPRNDPYVAFLYAHSILPNGNPDAAAPPCDLKGPVALFESADSPSAISIIGRFPTPLVLDPLLLSPTEVGRCLVAELTAPDEGIALEFSGDWADVEPATISAIVRQQEIANEQHRDEGRLVITESLDPGVDDLGKNNRGDNGRGSELDHEEQKRAADKKLAFQMLDVVFKDADRIMKSMSNVYK
jgi:hypothetical protein